MIPRAFLGNDYSISRVIKGGWHLAGGHGPIDPDVALRDMAHFIDAGITTFDCADIYTGVEALIGRFRAAYPEHAKRMQVHTKYVPDLSELPRIDGRAVSTAIDRSLERLGVECLDLVQFHWWDYSVSRCVEIALELNRLRIAGKIRHLGLTNFDTAHLAQVTAAGIPIVSHQVQYSLIDDRVNHGMLEFCQSHDVALLCYGTVAGGFLSERWLNQPEPGLELANRSLVKYRLIINEYGGWRAFQNLLQILHGVAVRHKSDIASVASRIILDRAQVAGVIVGAVNASHLPSNAHIGDIHLSDEDIAVIAANTAQRRGPSGDIYDLERDRTGAHGRIMKYELNTLPK